MYAMQCCRRLLRMQCSISPDPVPNTFVPSFEGDFGEAIAKRSLAPKAELANRAEQASLTKKKRVLGNPIHGADHGVYIFYFYYWTSLLSY